MRPWNRMIRIFIISVIGLAIAGLAGGIVFTDFIVDYWWHEELGFSEFFLLKLTYRHLILSGTTLFFFTLFFLNFWTASRYLGAEELPTSNLSKEEVRKRTRILRLFQSGSLKVFLPLSLILAIVIGTPFYEEWEAALLFIFGPAAGVTDSVFNNDVSFYLFAFPVFKLIQVELLFSTAILTLSIGFLYYLEHKLVDGNRRPWTPGAKIHIHLLIGLTLLVLCWGFMLERYDLLYTEAHEPQFFGPGFLEIRYYLPLIWLSIISLFLATTSWIRYVQKPKKVAVPLTISLIFVASVAVRSIDIIPSAIERFIVDPNPVRTEQAFMKNNIEATLSAYDLNDIVNIDVVPGLPDEDVLDPELRSHLYNIPVWDPEFLDDVYQQMQGIRPYYRFSHADVARYIVNGRLEQVNIAAREVNIDQLPAIAKNWENTHLRYTHGYGAVVTPAAQDGQTPMNWYLQGLDMQNAGSFPVERPDIYYGEEELEYAVVPNNLNIVGIPSVDEESNFNYTGRGGVPISSLFRKLLFSLYFKDEKLFFSVNVTGQSRALFHRNIFDRIRRLAPFLKLDGEPYIVVTPKRIFWVMDAFTTSDWYPLSKRSTTHFHGEHHASDFNYIRESVKVIVDAYDGHVDFYMTRKEPLVMAYRNAYPGLFKDIDEMPSDLRNQLRYPKDLFNLQMKVYARYHQKDPALFFEQAETWDFASVNNTKAEPYYLTTALEDYHSDKPGLVLIAPMTPVGRSNLSVLAVGGTFTVGPGMETTAPYDTQVVIYRYNREKQVDGPAQVNALIDQAPDIARQLTLWDQRGSKVLRGRIIVLPVGHSVLYVQPVYIVSTSGTKIPELQRIILSMGNVVVMSASLEEGILELEKKLTVMRNRNPAKIKAQPNLKPGEKTPTMSPIN